MKLRRAFAAGLAGLLFVGTVPLNAQASEVSGSGSELTVVDDDRRANLKSQSGRNNALAAEALGEESTNVSDAELVAFLLLAKGPIAERNPDAVAAAEEQIPVLNQISDQEALEASQEYVDASDSFSSEIRNGLLSENPVYVKNALNAFGEDFLEYIEKNTSADARAAQGLASATSGCNASVCVKQTAVALTTGLVLWQVAGLHTGAAVTIVAALAVFVYLPGDDRMSDIDEQRYVTQFMSNIRS